MKTLIPKACMDKTTFGREVLGAVSLEQIIEPLKFRDDLCTTNQNNPNSISTLRRNRKFQRKSHLPGPKLLKKGSLTNRLSGLQIEDKENNRLSFLEVSKRQSQNSSLKQHSQAQRTLIFPNRDPMNKKVGEGTGFELKYPSSSGPISPSTLSQSLSIEEFPRNIKPMRVCVHQFIYCAGKRMKFIPMASIIRNNDTHQNKVSEKNISTQHTIEEYNAKGLFRKDSMFN